MRRLVLVEWFLVTFASIILPLWFPEISPYNVYLGVLAAPANALILVYLNRGSESDRNSNRGMLGQQGMHKKHLLWGVFWTVFVAVLVIPQWYPLAYPLTLLGIFGLVVGYLFLMFYDDLFKGTPEDRYRNRRRRR